MRFLLTLATALLLFPGGALAAPSGRWEAEADHYRMEQAAALVAAPTGLSEDFLLDTWEDAPQVGLDAMYAALDQLGKGYRYASRGPNYFDCSGLTGYAWEEQDIEIGHNSGVQNRATFDIAEPVPGALVYSPGHVAMSLGVDDWIVHSANRRTGVVISQMSGDLTFPLRLSEGSNPEPRD